MTQTKKPKAKQETVAVFVDEEERGFVKADGLIDGPKRTSVRGSWLQAYESRMRRFNREVVLIALIALALAIAWLFIAWGAFQKSAPISRTGLPLHSD